MWRHWATSYFRFETLCSTHSRDSSKVVLFTGVPQNFRPTHRSIHILMHRSPPYSSHCIFWRAQTWRWGTSRCDDLHKWCKIVNSVPVLWVQDQQEFRNCSQRPFFWILIIISCYWRIVGYLLLRMTPGEANCVFQRYRMLVQRAV